MVTQQYTYRAGQIEKRADLMLLVNGLPLGTDRSQDAGSQGNKLGGRGAAGSMRITRNSYLSCSYVMSSPFPPKGKSFAMAPSACRSRIGGRGTWTMLRLSPSIIRCIPSSRLSKACSVPILFSIFWPTSPCSPPTRRNSAARSSAAISSTRQPTGSSSGFWQALPQGVESGIFKVRASPY